MTDEEFSEKMTLLLESDSDDSQAAKSHLSAGRPMYYCEDAYPNKIPRRDFYERRFYAAYRTSLAAYRLSRAHTPDERDYAIRWAWAWSFIAHSSPK